MELAELMKYGNAQRIAKRTANYIFSLLNEGMSELEISSAANRFMENQGSTSFWYHGIGSLVLVGKRTILSISGLDYKPTGERIGKNDLVTVDLGPTLDSYWGDFARSFVIANGKVATGPGCDPKSKELFDGIKAEKELHSFMREIADPEMTLGELFLHINKRIGEMGYINLDFRGNLGHSIEKDKVNRTYIEEGNNTRLSERGLFTFEPHLKRIGGDFGFKMEDIYYFSEGVLRKI